MKLATEGGFDKALAFVYNQMGTLYHYQGAGDSASLYYDKCESLYEVLGDTLGMLRPMFNHAVLKNGQQEYEKALNIYLKIAKIQEASGAKQDLCITKNAIANAYKFIGDYKRSLEYAQSSYEMADEIGGMVEKIEALHGMYEIYFKMDAHEKSLGLLKKAISIADSLGLTDKYVFLSNELADHHMNSEEESKALAILEHLTDTIQQLGGSRFEADVKLALAELYYFMEENEKAQATLEALLLNKIKESQRSRAVFVLAEIHQAKGDFSKAINLARSSFEGAEAIGYRLGMSKSAKLLADLYKVNNEYEKAFFFLDQSHTIKDSLINLEKVRKLTAMEKDFEFKLEKQQITDEQAQREALLKAETTQTRTAAGGIGGIALLGFGFFWNARRKNKTITLQNEQLAQLNDTKDRIFSIIGHDLRKPAIAFRGITKKVNYLLKKQDYKTLQLLGEEIEQDAFSLNKLTDNLLNWALTQKDVMPYNPQAIEVAEVTEEVISIFQKTAADKGIELSADIQESLEVFADVNALRTILRNLVDNAIKYTPAGGQVEISAMNTPKGINLQVSDTGIGMSAEKTKEIFLLQKNKSEKGTAGEKGTGLGMHLVNELVKLNKGAIEVVSQLGQGTKFEVMMPAVG